MGKEGERESYVLHSIVAHAAASYLAGVDGVLDSPPARQSRLASAVWAVQQEQIDVAEAAGVDTALDALTNGVVVGA